MQKSMTGFGIARLQTETKSISIEIKTLNSKYLDISIRLPHLFSFKELEVKNLIAQKLIRGKVNFSLSYHNKSESAQKVKINQNLAAQYQADIVSVAEALGLKLDDSEIFKQILAMPEIMEKEVDEKELENEWVGIKEQIIKALDGCDQFRQQEGDSISKHILHCLGEIETCAKAVKARENERIVRLRQRLMEQTKDIRESDQFSPDRFEQELIYYIEKLDITEEQIRLENHLKYFSETMSAKEANGKKLNFIAQELGREINTMGSKANDSGIQKYVVQMKDNLEQIKEQILNIL